MYKDDDSLVTGSFLSTADESMNWPNLSGKQLSRMLKRALRLLVLFH